MMPRDTQISPCRTRCQRESRRIISSLCFLLLLNTRVIVLSRLRRDLLGKSCQSLMIESDVRFESIRPGDPNLLVEYEGRIYCLFNDIQLSKFMKYVSSLVGIQLM